MTAGAVPEHLQEPVRDERFYRSSEWQFYMLWLRDQGREAEARQVCEEALAFNPTPQARFGIGISLLQEGLPREAAQMFQSAIDQKPGWASAHDGLGRALMELEHYDEAISVLSRLLETDPNHWPAYSFLGDAYRRKGDPLSAVRVYRDGLREWGDMEGYPDVEIGLGDALQATGRVEEALDVLASVTARYPNLPDAYLALGKVLHEVGRTGEARSAWERVLVLTRDVGEDADFQGHDISLGVQAQALLSETTHEK